MKTRENLNRECGLTRRGFVAACGALAASAAHGDEAVPQDSAASVPREQDPFLGTQGVPLEVGSPCLQAPGETTMGVSWAVSGLAKGVVEYADNPEMSDATAVRSGGYGLVPIDVDGGGGGAFMNGKRQFCIRTIWGYCRHRYAVGSVSYWPIASFQTITPNDTKIKIIFAFYEVVSTSF